MPSEKIEIFSRHCIASSISQHKERFPFFSHEACYRNLLDTFEPEKANLTFFLDTAKGSRESHFLSRERTHPLIEIQAGSEAGSFLRLLETVTSLDLSPETILYFVEDDYLHRPGWIDILKEGFTLESIEYITLYDHRDKYFFPEYSKLTSRLYLTPSCHWRTTPSTTQTFAVRFKTLLRDLLIHRRYSQKRTITADHKKFCRLQRWRTCLISPIPGWSTHAEPQYASPTIDWERITRSSYENACP